ncbi:GHMP kinase [bacterium]|nr:GHMP kinase [bacterium]
MRLSRAMKSFFGKGRTVYGLSAPGRLDVMGGIADYSGSLVLQMPTVERTEVYMALRADDILRVRSETASEAGLEEEMEIDLKTLLESPPKTIYQNANRILASNPKTSWAAYVLGCVVCMYHEANLEIGGADFWIDTNVPIGKGVSSSAALEIATITLLSRVLWNSVEDNQLPALAQIVENRIVGAPCGLMDQLATYYGQKAKLLPILCRPDRVDAPISIPPKVYFIGIDSGERHAVSGSSYSDVRTAAFMGYGIIAKQQGLTKTEAKNAKETGKQNGLPYKGYLTDISPSRFVHRYEKLLPEKIEGGAFKKRHGSTIDPITEPQNGREYMVRACTAHPIYEHFRVKEFSLLLKFLNAETFNTTDREALFRQMGELMYQSHMSYSRCGLGTPATDALVEKAYAAGPKQGVYGAKITGGGAGGTVCFLCFEQKGRKTVEAIAEEHARQFGCENTVFRGSSNGAKLTSMGTWEL